MNPIYSSNNAYSSNCSASQSAMGAANTGDNQAPDDLAMENEIGQSSRSGQLEGLSRIERASSPMQENIIVSIKQAFKAHGFKYQDINNSTVERRLNELNTKPEVFLQAVNSIANPDGYLKIRFGDNHGHYRLMLDDLSCVIARRGFSQQTRTVLINANNDVDQIIRGLILS